jgi:hypothetical protein
MNRRGARFGLRFNIRPLPPISKASMGLPIEPR